MASELIKKHLAELKSQKKFDEGFIDILAEANETSEEILAAFAGFLIPKNLTLLLRGVANRALLFCLALIVPARHHSLMALNGF